MLTKKKRAASGQIRCMHASAPLHALHACAQRPLHACASTQGQKGLFNGQLTPLVDGFDCGVILEMKVQVSVK